MKYARDCRGRAPRKAAFLYRDENGPAKKELLRGTRRRELLEKAACLRSARCLHNRAFPNCWFGRLDPPVRRQRLAAAPDPDRAEEAPRATARRDHAGHTQTPQFIKWHRATKDPPKHQCHTGPKGQVNKQHEREAKPQPPGEGTGRGGPGLTGPVRPLDTGKWRGKQSGEPACSEPSEAGPHGRLRIATSRGRSFFDREDLPVIPSTLFCI